jgi:hypothetical protein
MTIFCTCRKRRTGAPCRQHWWVCWQAAATPPAAAPPTGHRGGDTPAAPAHRGGDTAPTPFNKLKREAGPLLGSVDVGGGEDATAAKVGVSPLSPFVDLSRAADRASESTSVEPGEWTGVQLLGVTASCVDKETIYNS